MPSINLVIKAEVVKAYQENICFWGDDGKQKQQELTFKIDEVLYGEYADEEIKIHESYIEDEPYNKDQGFGFKKGEEYLVFVRKYSNDHFRSSANGLCREAWPLDSKRAETEIEKVKKYNITKE